MHVVSDFKARLFWVLRPTAIVFVVCFVLYPGHLDNVGYSALVAFLLGGVLGGFLYREPLHHFLFERTRDTRLLKNTLPRGFFLGDKK